MMLHAAPFMTGFALFASLSVAIGPQSLFVLQQGLRKNHTGLIVLFCSLSDVALIVAGAGFAHGVFLLRPTLARGLTLAGAVFLLWNGIRSLKQAMDARTIAGKEQNPFSCRTTLLVAAGFTWLNPQVYLDTVLLIGSATLAQPPPFRPSFSVGAIMASFLWFTALGYGARLLRPIFTGQRPRQYLNILTGSAMLCLAVLAIRTALGPPFPFPS
ncbi:LysE family transporter [Asaia sp. BMEF1]|uniref:LysE/ArgO family amino acid transporter n=1 Tax=Asaia sp. BMEF1 TaxID=3155932 RepID=UPI003F67E62B